MSLAKTAKLRLTAIGQASCLAATVLFAANTQAQQELQPADLVSESGAEDVRRYSVELIIFEYDGGNAGTELFLPDPLPENSALNLAEDGQIPVYSDETTSADSLAALSPDRAVIDEAEIPAPADDPEALPELTADELVLGEIPGPAQINLQIMDPADFTLSETYEKLANLGAYTPLLHTGWTQDAVEEEETRSLRLRRLGNPPLRLDGEVSLYLSRYLHLVVDLELEDRVAVSPQTVEVNDAPSEFIAPEPTQDLYDPYVSPTFAPVHYRILEDRIVRNGELRYYDHPKFGVLAKIARIEEAEAMPEEFDASPESIADRNSQSDF